MSRISTRTLGALAIATALLPASAALASQSDSETVVVTGSRSDPNAIICKSNSSAGSHILAPRECRTKRQWDDIRRRSQSQLDGVQFRALTAPPPM